MDIAVTPEASALLELRGDPSFATRNRLAMQDVRQGTRLLKLAWTLAWLDIRLRYRGSMLGPLWLTLSTGIMVGALGYLYAGIFHTDIHDYLPYLALSLVLWGFLGSVVSEACSAFTESEGIVRAVRMPFFLFAVRLLVRNVIVLAHNVLVIVVVFAVFRVWPRGSRCWRFPDRCSGRSMRSRLSCCWAHSARGSVISCLSWPV